MLVISVIAKFFRHDERYVIVNEAVANALLKFPPQTRVRYGHALLVEHVGCKHPRCLLIKCNTVLVNGFITSFLSVGIKMSKYSRTDFLRQLRKSNVIKRQGMSLLEIVIRKTAI
jgi:hypothetical protein